MNYKVIFYTIGQILKVEAALLCAPLVISFIYRDGNYLSFIIPIAILFLIGTLLTLKKKPKMSMYAKEGFAIVGLSWILMSIFGALPFVISKEIPNFIDAFFETVSGFTTTGASILKAVEDLSPSMIFWRSFTHWVGGMGVLVFVLAILPDSEARSIHILRAESPGPQVGKLVSKIRYTARILYGIYIVLTIIEIIFLVCGGQPFFDSMVDSFATAGTGGFSIKNDGLTSYSAYSQIVIGIFMIIFGINFNLFYLLIIGQIRSALKSEELRWYLGIIFTSIVIITINLWCQATSYYGTLGETIRHAFFQVSSIITTTGFATTDFNTWPVLSKTVLLLLMVVGACAGSTGGGLKVSRLVILLKSIKQEFKKLIHPNSVSNISFEGKPLDDTISKGVVIYFGTLTLIALSCFLLISIDNLSIESNFSAVLACINNIGPGLDQVGPYSNYSAYSGFSKIVLSFAMLIGRLEIYPILMLFNPALYRNR